MNDAPAKIVSVVTGAGRGLGRQAALALASRHDVVALVGRNEPSLRDTQRAITEQGGVAGVFPADVSDIEAVAQLRLAVERELGAVSVLVNAAGVFGPIQLVKEMDPRQWLQTVSVDLFGPFLMCRAFLPAMLEQRWGRIVNVSSAASLHPPGPLNSAYGTSKVALNQFTRHLAAEIHGTGVTANVIHPGDVKTDMWADIRDQTAGMGSEAEGYRKWVQWVEATGGDDPEKAAALIMQLTARDSDQINGAFRWIKGGLQAPIPSWPTPDEERPWQ